MELVRKNNDRARVHAFGIGHDVSVSLVKSCALLGKGQLEFIRNASEIEMKVL